MTVLTSRVDRSSDAFAARAAHMEGLLAELRERTALVAAGGGERATERHRSRGKLTARERIDLLVDPGTAFLELNALAAWDIYDGQAPAAGIVTGIGVIEGRCCVVVANDATVKGGSYFPLTVKKHLRAQEVAEQNHLPCVYLVDSGGAFLPAPGRRLPRPRALRADLLQPGAAVREEHPPDRGRDGLLHRRRRLRPGDERRDGDRRGNRHDLHRRPAAREGRDRRGRHGRGARRRRAAHATLRRRRPLRRLGRARARARPSDRPPPRRPIAATLGARRPEPPAVDPAELYGIVPEHYRHELDPLEVIARIVDGSRFHEFKALYGDTLVCGFARIEGHPVGILANRGVLFAESAQKGAHFIELACKRRIPLVFLQNITGFMVGKDAEEGGIARDGAKLVTAVACAEVPKFTVVTGGSFGAGNYAMCGRAYGPRQLWMWPNARISVMGGEQAATVLSMVGTPTRRDPRDYEREGHRTSRPRASGTTASSTRSTPAVLALGSPPPRTPRPETTFGVFRM